jgi:RNA polymerase sigma factor (sigma-70 family)
MIENPSDADLVTRAADGDQRAWDALVDRYAPLVWSICREHSLSDAHTHNIGQAIWLQLMSQFGNLREPAALAGWLATTTRRECRKVRHATRELQAGGHALNAETIPDQQTGLAEHELRAAERDAVLREAFTRLPPCCQRLIAMLTEDPPMPYAQISATLDIPVGSIGSSRSRCLNKLRRDPALAALINPGAASAGGGLSRQVPRGKDDQSIPSDQALEPRRDRTDNCARPPRRTLSI